jgi:hypothetical protein
VNIAGNVNKLKAISEKLNMIDISLSCPVVTSQAYRTQVSLQYDYFMEFIGLYEDTQNYLDEQEQTLDIRRYKKELNQFWRMYEI